jgi:hypothetical protein
MGWVIIVIDWDIETKEEVRMRYSVEYDAKNFNKATVHVDVDLSVFAPKPTLVKWSPERDADCFYDDCRDSPFFIKRLSMVSGVVEVFYNRYSVIVIKGEIFPWRKLIPAIVRELETSVNRGGRAKPVRKPAYKSSSFLATKGGR